MKRKALVVLSGGQDSTTCLFWAKKLFEEVHAITFDYGQTHRLEIQCAKNVAKLADVASHQIVTIPNVLKSVSPLVDASKPLHKYESFEQMEEEVGDKIENTFVPLRNPFFLIVAANYAVELGCTELVTGVCQSDDANYPDCTAAFIEKTELMINEALGNKMVYGLKDDTNKDKWVKIHTPLIDIDKSNTCWLAWKLGFDCWRAMASTMTSYDGKYPPTDNNHSNVLRAKAFENAGLPDPLVVRAWHENKMDLPKTANYEAIYAYMALNGSMHPLHYDLDELLGCIE